MWATHITTPNITNVCTLMHHKTRGSKRVTSLKNLLAYVMLFSTKNENTWLLGNQTIQGRKAKSAGIRD